MCLEVEARCSYFWAIRSGGRDLMGRTLMVAQFLTLGVLRAG